MIDISCTPGWIKTIGRLVCSLYYIVWKYLMLRMQTSDNLSYVSQNVKINNSLECLSEHISSIFYREGWKCLILRMPSLDNLSDIGQNVSYIRWAEAHSGIFSSFSVKYLSWFHKTFKLAFGGREEFCVYSLCFLCICIQAPLLNCLPYKEHGWEQRTDMIRTHTPITKMRRKLAF